MTKRSIFIFAATAAFCAGTAAANAAGSILVGDKEMAAAGQATMHHAHTRATTNANGVRRSEALTLREERSADNTLGVDEGSAGNTPGATAGVRYPADLQYYGGAVVLSMQSHPVYVNTSATCPNNTCWGNPEAFLHDLADSKLIHVVDQYVGSDAPRRYTLGSSTSVTIPTSAGVPLTDTQIRAAVFAVASAAGQVGYGHVYHVFLPPGQDECLDFVDPTLHVCYSPDNPDTFVYCAYHDSVTFKGLGHVLYTVEPFQNVPGCQVRPGTPNGQLVDSTNDVLSHELIETITDPDINAWRNAANIGAHLDEIADTCVFLTPDLFFFDPSNIIANGKRYAVQPEYSNRQHLCVTNAKDE